MHDLNQDMDESSIHLPIDEEGFSDLATMHDLNQDMDDSSIHLAIDDEDFIEIMNLLAQGDNAPLLVQDESAPKTGSRNLNSVDSMSIQKTRGIRAPRSTRGSKVGIADVVYQLYAHICQHGEFDINSDYDDVFKTLPRTPIKQRIYDAVRWLESFGLVERRADKFKFKVFLVV